MPHFAANLSCLFKEVSLMERFAAARRAGFDAVELMFPYQEDLDLLKARLIESGLELILFSLPAGNWASGDRGAASDPRRKQEFREGIARGIETAKALGVSRLNCLVGLKREDVSDGETRASVLDNIRYAAGALANAGIKLMVEPLNHLDMPGFALNTCGETLKILGEIGHPNAFLLLDVYHARRENEDLAELLRDHLGRIGHIRIADCPGRHQPGTGKTDFRFLLAEIERLGYRGYISLAYVPTRDTLSSLDWLHEYGHKL